MSTPLKFLFFTLTSVTIAFSLFSCQKESEPSVQNSGNEKIILGKWHIDEFIDEQTYGNMEIDSGYYDRSVSFYETFNDDNTCEVLEGITTFHGTYKINNDSLLIDRPDGWYERYSIQSLTATELLLKGLLYDGEGIRIVHRLKMVR